MIALGLDHVSKRFGGNVVLDRVTFAIESGQRVAIIGPNGAGKSTLFDVVSGATRPTAGAIRLDGRDVTRLAAHERSRRGLARSFQLTRLLRGLTVYDNLLAALHGRERSALNVLRPAASPSYGALLTEADSLLEELGLSARRTSAVHALSFGEQKKLEVAMTLALRPTVLMLDEPAAGLDPGDVDEFVRTVRRVAGSATLVFTEHDMAVVFDLADRVLVLSRGRLVADDAPAAISESAIVRELYLGAEPVDDA